jgi:hypothetical protein
MPYKGMPVLSHSRPKATVISVTDIFKHLSNVGQAVPGQANAELMVREQVLVGLMDAILHDDE